MNVQHRQHQGTNGAKPDDSGGRDKPGGRRIARVVSLLVSFLVLLPVMVCVSSADAQYGSLGSLGSGYSGPSTGSVVSGLDSPISSPIYVAQAGSAVTPVPIPASSYGNVYQPATAATGYPTTNAASPNTSSLLGGTSGSSTLFIQPIDPYATPTQSSLFAANSVPGTATQNVATTYPCAPSASTPVYSGQWDKVFPETYQAMRRFREATEFTYTMMPGGKGANDFGINEIDLRMQLSIPCRFIPSSGNGEQTGFFYIAPGANLLWWSGPHGPPDMSPNGFGAFIDIGMNPRFNEVFAMDGWFRFGVYSDFKKVKSDALRYQGRLVGIFTVSPTLQIVAGAQYLDRVRIKILPVGGVVWTPNSDWNLRLVFPNPKISRRISNTGRAEWWAYAAAEYGGGSWYVNGIGQTDYNDIRVGVGLEFETYTRINGHVEVGGAFNRELHSKHAQWNNLSDAFYLKLGIVF